MNETEKKTAEKKVSLTSNGGTIGRVSGKRNSSVAPGSNVNGGAGSQKNNGNTIPVHPTRSGSTTPTSAGNGVNHARAAAGTKSPVGAETRDSRASITSHGSQPGSRRRLPSTGNTTIIAGGPTPGIESKSSMRRHPSRANSISSSPHDVSLPKEASPLLQSLAYEKDPVVNATAEKKIMRLVFDSIDVNKTGTLCEKDVETLFSRTGNGVLTAEELGEVTSTLFKNGPPDFERLWTVWNSDIKTNEKSIRNFKLLSTRFELSFSQQQLFTQEVGEIFTPEYRVMFFLKDINTEETRQISPWHDIPLHIKNVVRTEAEDHPLNKYNFICEIPKWTRAKFEIATIEPYNPIKQDVSAGALRFYKHGDMLFNYGALPQTWESIDHSFDILSGEKTVSYKGDNDPVDVIEIGTQQLATGSVTAVKVLGILGMIDAGEMDWKVIAISISDPLAMFMDDIGDVLRYMPGALECLRTWLRDYKICTGGKQNEFVCGGEYLDRERAQEVIEACHNHWRNFHLVQERKET
ncbi:putative inorganic pyrophosphatase 1 [Diplonema papillatum]|nr:putative inorganic pyrophosphatase 1 [Diplonema papillatum]